MRKVVLGALYLVVAASVLFAVLATYSLYELWDAKNQIGTAKINIMQIVGTSVFGAGLPYCMIHYLRKK